MGILDEIERSDRRTVTGRIRGIRCAPWYYATGIALIVAPCALMQALYVPFLGQGLVGIASLLSLYYLWSSRAWILALGAVAGVIVAISIAIAISSISLDFITQLLYPLAGISTAVLIAYIIFIGGAIASRIERAEHDQTSAPHL